MNLETIKKALVQIKEQSDSLSAKYQTGGGKFCYLLDFAWCRFCYGASPKDYVRFEFEKKRHSERNRYLTLYRYFKLLKKIYRTLPPEYQGNKAGGYKAYAEFIKRDWISVDASTEESVVREFITTQGVVFAKPISGGQGNGVVKIKYDDSRAIGELLENRKSCEYVVEGFVKNDATFAAFHPQSLNTIRCYTFVDKHGKVHLLEMMLRTGTKGNHVDNWGSGGIGWVFDVATGICSQPGVDKKNNPYIYHPDTGIQMVGFQLPMYDELKAYIIALCKVEPRARFVGWDIAYTDKGFDLVETNCPGGHDFLQVFGRPWGQFMKENW